jgi:hypothetical protein
MPSSTIPVIVSTTVVLSVQRVASPDFAMMMPALATDVPKVRADIMTAAAIVFLTFFIFSLLSSFDFYCLLDTPYYNGRATATRMLTVYVTA